MQKFCLDIREHRLYVCFVDLKYIIHLNTYFQFEFLYILRNCKMKFKKQIFINFLVNFHRYYLLYFVIFFYYIHNLLRSVVLHYDFASYQEIILIKRIKF